MLQSALPGFEMLLRPVCPACGALAPVLGQHSPFRRWYVCEACNRAAPFPTEIYELIDGRLDYAPDAPRARREQRVRVEHHIDRAVMARRPARNSSHGPIPPRLASRQLSIPVCKRCGRPHARWVIADYSDYCQRCEDEMSVEALWRLYSTIFQGDPEDALDRIYRSHQGLFERGVLPDMWFRLMAG